MGAAEKWRRGTARRPGDGRRAARRRRRRGDGKERL